MPDPAIRVRGAHTHNLQDVDVELPYRKLIVLCGVSGSGKSSLAVDTLYAEGQRRYVETFSPYARQFLERLPRPDVEEVEGLPPPVRVKDPGRSARRLTVGTLTETYDYLRLLFARVGEVVCPACRRTVRPDRLDDVVTTLGRLPEGARLLITFPAGVDGESPSFFEDLRSLGFRRAIVGDRLIEIGGGSTDFHKREGTLEIVADRLIAGRADAARLAESLEVAREQGGGQSVTYVEAVDGAAPLVEPLGAAPAALDGHTFWRCPLSDHFVCKQCGREFTEPDPQLFNFSSAAGACPRCEGIGAIRPGGRLPKRGGRWQTCPDCQGRRLRPEALAVQFDGNSIAQIAGLPADEVSVRITAWSRPDSHLDVPPAVVMQLQQRLSVLAELGISYLRLDQSIHSLSRGERQRVSLARGLGSSLVNSLYVLDEPTTGLHPADLPAMVEALHRLRDRGNTVLVVEHERQVLRTADLLVELGPGAGQEGGRVVFHGRPDQIVQAKGSATGDWLAGRRAAARDDSDARRQTEHGWIRLADAHSKNLKHVSVKFPLGVLCVVTGVSGAGKTALVHDALYGAMQEYLDGKSAGPPTWSGVQGAEQVGRLERLDQALSVHTSRSNPVTYVKAFNVIRRVFADTIDAKTRGYEPGFFSFNVPGGRCEKCKGEGSLTVDMQFLPDLSMVCPECNGRRYARDALAVLYRGRSIADVLDMTVREAIGFFRGQAAVQTRLQCLKDAGLDYLRLGQPAATLSGGEAQRLKLASLLQGKRAARTLYLLDEPTAGLHATDVPALLDCFDALLAVGHSLIVVSHSLQLVQAADYVVDLGPGAGERGGAVVACGTPEQIAAHPESVTGRYL